MTLPTGQTVRFVALLFAVAAIAACGGGDPSQVHHPPSTASDFNLPADDELPGWLRATEPEHYEADNLWEYINGQADFFIDYGFGRVDTAEYRNDQASISVVLEVYQMGRPQEAFGIFAAERTRDDQPLEIGAGAYLGSNVLGFWQGRLYVKLTSFYEGPAVEASLVGFAREISTRLPSPGQGLEIFSFFPQEGRVEASERYLPKNFLGQPYLTNAYRVDYLYDNQPLQIFLVDADSTEEAQSHFSRLGDFYRGQDRANVAMETTREFAMMIVDGPSKLIVFQIDHRLGGVIGVEDLELGRAAAARLAENITR